MKICLAVLLLSNCVCWGQEPSADWSIVSIPEAFRNVPKGELAPIDGYSWYRCLVDVPADWEGDEITLHVEALDDARATYINGNKVGATGTFPPQYRSGLGENGEYSVSANLWKPGSLNSVAVQVYQNDPRPNFSVAPPVLVNLSKRQGIRLNGEWQYRPGNDAKWKSASPADFETASQPKEGEPKISGVYSKVDAVQDIQRYVSKREGDNDPLSPEQAAAAFEVPDDLEIQLVLSEPEITQPLFMTWDSKGRMWVMEYRQYPEVAGVKMLSRDVFLRSVYDKAPEPPPHGAKGLDRISIHEDVDGDGVYDKHKTFVDGLNIASSFAIGRGGVFVTNPPYLLFYPDQDGDDIPDGDPEVLLEGFGLEDSHSVINSLRFGPDGWLYGCQGSTVTGRVKRPGSAEAPIQTMGQQIWRYHPESRHFEVFAEGGGNTFGCEIDSKGNVFSGHNGGDTRGFHYVQGGYYQKGFGKHGPLSNPYAFGYFPSIKHDRVPRFTHNFVIYEEGVLPDQYEGRLFGIEPLQGQVVMSDIRPFQSSFETEDISRVVKANDQWFRPVDIKAGPDGSIYIADMYEQRIDHSSHYAGRIDRDSGRIYRLRKKSESNSAADQNRKVDFAKLPTLTLVEKLRSENRANRQTIIRIMGDRKDPSVIPVLVQSITEGNGQVALESLWALHASGGLTPELAADLLHHQDSYVRAWTVRFLGDSNVSSNDVGNQLALLAADEPTILVRKQLASSARRLPTEIALPIIRNLLQYDEDSSDIHQPLLLWWALESKASTGQQHILDVVFADADTWQRQLVREHLVERLIKRYALAGTREQLIAAAKLLEASPDTRTTKLLLKGFEDAYAGRSLSGIPNELVNALARTGGGSLSLRLRQGNEAAITEAMNALSNSSVPLPKRAEYIEILGQLKQPEHVDFLLNLAFRDSNKVLQKEAFAALQSTSDVRIGNAVIQRFVDLQDEVREAAETLLCSRPEWSHALLVAVDQGKMKPSDLSEAALKKMLLHDSEPIQTLVRKHWGQISGASSEDMKRRISELATVLQAGSGNPKKGKPLFMKNCGQCHLLFGEGGEIGPDLTSFKRDNTDRMLANIVNPSLEIREGFESHVIVTEDGRVVSGLLVDKDNQVAILRGVNGQNVIVPLDDIDEMIVSKTSLMPEGTLKGLTEQQLRDLFAYFRSSQPVNY